MMLDAPLAPVLEADIDDRPGKEAQSRLKIIDGDVHPALRSTNDLNPYLPARWREHLEIYGSRRKLGEHIPQRMFGKPTGDEVDVRQGA